jgi:hypothetical protein
MPFIFCFYKFYKIHANALFTDAILLKFGIFSKKTAVIKIHFTKPFFI